MSSRPLAPLSPSPTKPLSHFPLHFLISLPTSYLIHLPHLSSSSTSPPPSHLPLPSPILSPLNFIHVSPLPSTSISPSYFSPPPLTPLLLSLLPRARSRDKRMSVKKGKVNLGRKWKKFRRYLGLLSVTFLMICCQFPPRLSVAII